MALDGTDPWWAESWWATPDESVDAGRLAAVLLAAGDAEGALRAARCSWDLSWQTAGEIAEPASRVVLARAAGLAMAACGLLGRREEATVWEARAESVTLRTRGRATRSLAGRSPGRAATA